MLQTRLIVAENESQRVEVKIQSGEHNKYLKQIIEQKTDSLSASKKYEECSCLFDFDS
jgi:hypothetical protein